MRIVDKAILILCECEECGEEVTMNFSCETVDEAEWSAMLTRCNECGHANTKEEVMG